jgi:hypothetical protein
MTSNRLIVRADFLVLAELLALVRKLDDSDWLFPSGSWQNDVDLFGG